MVDGGLYDKVPIPDIVVGAHVMPERAGTYAQLLGHLSGLTIHRSHWNKARVDREFGGLLPVCCRLRDIRLETDMLQTQD